MATLRLSRNPWRRPGPPVYLEGAPSPAEAERERAVAAAALAAWRPTPEAHALLAELRSAVGQTVVVQAWDPIMFYIDDEAPAPIRAVLRDVVTRDEGEGERAFLVLDGGRSEEPQLFDVADLYELTTADGPAEGPHAPGDRVRGHRARPGR